MALRQALVWPPIYDAKNQRVKGFYPRVVRDKEVEPLLDSMRHYRTLYPDATRISLRAAIPKAVLERNVLSMELEGINVEAQFPIHHIVPGCWVAYVSFTEHARMSEIARNDLPVSEPAPLDRQELECRTRRYRIVQITSMDARTLSDFVALFDAMFDVYPVDIGAEAIRKMPDDHIVMAAYDRDDLVAVFMADRAHIDLNYRIPITFFDFVNVASKKDGLLLIPWMARQVVDLAERYVNPIIYAEARDDVAGLQTCCSRAGMRYCGMLSASSLFKDKNDEAPAFRNAQVWYIPRENPEEIPLK